jgi:hypothetical protein
VPENALSPQEMEKWDEINRRVSAWAVNIVDVKESMPNAEDYDGYPNKYEEFGIIPVKEIG